MSICRVDKYAIGITYAPAELRGWAHRKIEKTTINKEKTWNLMEMSEPQAAGE